MRNGMLVLLAFVAAGFAFPTLTSAGSNPTTAIGTYRDWNGDIDEVTIVQPFHAVGYTNIAVESFDTSGVSLPNSKDNTYEAVQSALRLTKPAFIDGLVKNLRRKTGTPVGGDTLIIRARLIKVDPGSQAARYWGGFGAGAVKIAITGEIVDGRTEKALVRFTQERRSGFGMFGGGYGALFTRTARQIGGDIATLINAF